ncbi:MAG: hypothetical protein Kow0037_14690 [Calditrichia bacterium]
MMTKTCSLLILLTLTTLTFSQTSVPAWHWTLPYLDQLKTAGYLEQIDWTNRPLQREEIAETLAAILLNDLPPQYRKIVQILKKEFPRIQKAIAETPGVRAEADFRARQSAPDFVNHGAFEIYPQLRWQAAPRTTFYAALKVFNRAPDGYIGKEFRDLFAYIEQGYLNYRGRYLNFTLGRDFLQTGAGRSGQLLLSDAFRPMDHYRLRVGGQHIAFSFMGAQLDRRYSPDAGAWANRFMNGHRLHINLKNRYYLNFSEMVIYGGPQESWNLAFMNPFGFYYGVTTNGPATAANFLYSIDWDFYLPYRLNFYGELLIDDLQVDKKTPGDLEPDEIGLLLGLNWHPEKLDPALRVNLEYAQVRNRTYNAPQHDWERWVHRNKPLGYWLGNDFKRWQLQVEKLWRQELRTRIAIARTLKGEGDVFGEFNTDYLNYTVEEGYDEPFPWGIVQKEWQWGGEISWPFKKWLVLQASCAWHAYNNYRHQTGKKHDGFSFSAGLFFRGPFLPLPLL